MAFFVLSFGGFLTFWVVFFAFGAGIPCFCALPLFFLPLFSSDGVKICDFWGVFPLFLLLTPAFYGWAMHFLAFFTAKGENRRKNRRNFGEFLLFLRFLCLLSAFWLVFFDFWEERVLSGVFFAPFSLFFGEGIAFLSVLSLLRLLIFCRATKNGNF